MKYKHVLVIDDDIDDIEIFVTAIKRIKGPLRCSSEDDSVQALDRLLSGELVPDLIFLDLNMPVMNGFQCLKKMKEASALRKIPVIILSTSADPAAKAELIALGASQFITKPDNFEDLHIVLKHILLCDSETHLYHSANTGIGLD